MKKEWHISACLLLVLLVTGCQVKEGDLQDQSETPVTIVILGSSTAAGTGPKDITNAWVSRYIAYLEEINHDHRVINLAKGGYTTYHMMPRDYVPPEGRPKPDPGRCIAMALLLDPSAIIINLPSNDAAYGYSVVEQLANYDSILTAADLESVPIWITTTQPRNLSIEKRQNLMDMRDSTWSRFGSKAVDFWTSLAQEDGRIDSAFDCGDGVHVNDLGHNILFERVVAAAVLDSVLSYGN
jgi:lysophospholipase L1-like esterase